jgi:hypothetical protein
MADAETAPENREESQPDPGPAIPGAPIGRRKPDAIADPMTDPEIPELQDRRRPLP